MLSFGRHSGWRLAGVLVAAVAVASSCTQFQKRPPPWPTAHRTGDTHLVVAGDQMGKLARTYGVTLAALAEANGVGPPYTIYVGQELRIPGRGAPAPVEQPPAIVQPAAVATEKKVASASVASQPVAAPSRPAAATPAVTRHVVQRGDNLLAIAERFQVHPDDLAAANGLHPPYQVLVGQALRIPGTAERRKLSPASPQIASRSAAEPSPVPRKDVAKKTTFVRD